MEGIISGTIDMMSALSGQTIRATEATFTGAGPEDKSEHEAVFGCPVHFNRPRNSLSFPEAVFACRVTQPSRELLALFETHTVEHLRKLDDKLIYARKVGEEVARMLQGEAPNINVVAQKLAMSPRNLQLKLRQEGTSYRETLDRVRKDLALGHLKNRHTTVAEVAYLLGFSEPSVFHRTFKRWTGSTPRDFRHGLGAREVAA
jgi:AraC-like DNA-binding protein